MFKEILLDLMSQENLNQIELSTAAKIPKTTISGWINADRLPDYSALLKLSNFFNVTADFLLGKSNEYAPSNRPLPPNSPLVASDGTTILPMQKAPALDTEAKRALDIFTGLSDHGKKQALALLKNVQLFDVGNSANQKPGDV